MLGFFKRLVTSRSSSFSIPDGERVYAIGDIHGRLDLFKNLLDQIEHDVEHRPPARNRLILLGDLVDRGPDSAGVVARARAIAAAASPGDMTLIKGNHEEMFINAARGDGAAARSLMAAGGLATILSYGIDEFAAQHGSFDDLAALLQQQVPVEDIDYLDAAEDWLQIGDYVFVHAGIKPGVAMTDQIPSNLRWSRGEFLRSRQDHGAMIIHGHTIVRSVDEQPNRIGIDTGAYETGVLTAIGLEGSDRWFLSTGAE